MWVWNCLPTRSNRQQSTDLKLLVLGCGLVALHTWLVHHNAGAQLHMLHMVQVWCGGMASSIQQLGYAAMAQPAKEHGGSRMMQALQSIYANADIHGHWLLRSWNVLQAGACFGMAWAWTLRQAPLPVHAVVPGC